MIICYLNVKCVAINEPETDAPLVVDGDGILPFSLPLEGVQSITGRGPQVIEPGGEMDIFQATNRSSDQVWRQAFRFAFCEHLLGIAIRERSDHMSFVNCHVTVVKSLFSTRQRTLPEHLSRKGAVLRHGCASTPGPSPVPQALS